MEPERLAWMRDCVDPPERFTVYVCQGICTRIPPGLALVHRIDLPASATINGRTSRFVRRRVGVFGLDAAIVWHPGWPIEHPLVAEGGAAVLWPNPVAIDFAALGEGEVRIVGDNDSEDAT